METSEAKLLAQDLMAKHGLREWSFKLNKNKRLLGICKESNKRIELSQHYVTMNDESHVLDTILHEIAHALVGAKHGHDAVWKDMCRQLGCSPRACEKSVTMPVGDWRAQCPSCKKEISRHRRPDRLRGFYCINCGPEKGILKFVNFKMQYQKRIDHAVAKKPEAVQLMLKIF